MSYNLHLKINTEDKDKWINYHEINEIVIKRNNGEEDSYTNFKVALDPLEFVCDDLANQYIENIVDDELKPLFRESVDHLSDYIYNNTKDIVDIEGVLYTADKFKLDNECK